MPVICLQEAEVGGILQIGSQLGVYIDPALNRSQQEKKHWPGRVNLCSDLALVSLAAVF